MRNFIKKHWKQALIAFSLLALVMWVVSCVDRPIINKYENNTGAITTSTFIHEEVDSSTVYKK